jgi:4a-hydroxytetrahydrobiopterin dehydratase
VKQLGQHSEMSFQREQQVLRMRVRFLNFQDAFAFMSDVAKLAEHHDHHPDWRNVYNLVDITLTTHDAGNQVTEKDLRLASDIEGLASLQKAEVLPLET